MFESPLGLFDPETLGRDARGALRHPAPPADRPDEPVVRASGSTNSAATSRDSASRSIHAVAAAPDRASPRPSRATRTTRTSPRWSARSTSASSRCYAQNDPDAYSYSGGLNRANQGMLEFVEMFKAPIKMLHPLLTATQEGNYIGTENIGAIPFTGIILAHSNEAEWQTLQEQQEQRSLHRPHLRHQGAVLPARHRGAEDLREADPRLRAVARRPARRRRSRCWRASRCCRACASTRTPTLFAKMRVYDGESLKESRSEGAQRCRNTRTRPASTKAWTASRRASPSRCWRRPSTTTPPRSRPIRCT